MDNRADKILWPAVVISLAVKLMLAAAIPITSDEAYFTLWGRFLDYGYYDHPPMAGWLLYLISFLGNSTVLVRLPAVLSTILVALGIYAILKPLDEKKAVLVSVFLLVSPLNILNVIITTDTPLIFFSFLSSFLLYYAQKKDGYLLYAASGAALGLAFLSKYFAVFLGLGYAAYYFFSQKNRRKTYGFLILFLTAVPFIALNIYWNYTHCWANIMFNVFNRNKKEEFSLVKLILFAVSQAYLLTPGVIYFLAKRRKDIAESIAGIRLYIKDSGFEVFVFIFAVPLALFALLSVKKVIGLHWALSFYPFMYLLAFLIFNAEDLSKTVKITAVFTIIHLFLAGTALSLPLSLLKDNKNYGTIIMGTKPYEIRKALIPYEGRFVLATPSYADSALLSYHYGNYFIVFGGGSHHARQDDMLTDFRTLDGRDMLILRTSEPRINEYSTFFRNIEIERKVISGAVFFFVSGYGFNYANYRDAVLKDIRDKYYNIPSWLPVSGSCYFFTKYFQ